MNTKSKGLLAYLALTFGLAWGYWLIVILAGYRPDASRQFQTAIMPGAFAPAIAAILVRKRITREGFGDADLKLNLHKWPYFLLGWFLPLIVMVIVISLASAFEISLPDFSLQRGYPLLSNGKAAPEGVSFPATVLRLVLSVPFMAPILFGEEFGWRGYLQVRLLADHPTLAAIITGLIWAAWHLPVNLIGYNDIGDPVLSLTLFTIGTIIMSIIFGWLQEKTGSIWAPSLAHAANNGLGGTLAMLLFAGGRNYTWVSYGGVLSMIPLGFLALLIAASRQISGLKLARVEQA